MFTTIFEAALRKILYPVSTLW